MQRMSSRLSHVEVTHLPQYPYLAYWWRQEGELIRGDGLSVLLSPMTLPSPVFTEGEQHLGQG